MAHTVTFSSTNIGSVSFHRNSATDPTIYHACVTNDYFDVIEVGEKTNTLVDSSAGELDESQQYFYGIRMRAFNTYTASGGSISLTASQEGTATQLTSRLYTYGGGGSTFGLGELLDGLPTTGFLRPPTDIAVPVGGYTKQRSSDVMYFAKSSTDTSAVIPLQESVFVGDVSASINLLMNTPESTVRITMPLLYVPHAFHLDSNKWLWCYPMIYNAQGVPYGS